MEVPKGKISRIRLDKGYDSSNLVTDEARNKPLKAIPIPITIFDIEGDREIGLIMGNIAKATLIQTSRLGNPSILPKPC